MLHIIEDIFQTNQNWPDKNCRLKSRITFLKAYDYLFHPMFQKAKKKFFTVLSHDLQNKLTHRD